MVSEVGACENNRVGVAGGEVYIVSLIDGFEGLVTIDEKIYFHLKKKLS